VAQKKRPEIYVTITARILHGAKFPLAHLLDSRLSCDKNPESLSHLGLNRYQVVTDRQTNRITIANTRLAVPVKIQLTVV